MTKTVYVLTSGGTIEKVYREGTGAVENVGSKIDRYLKLWRLPECEVNVVLMNKDSPEMTDQDRVLILGMVRAILKEKVGIVITPWHGYDGSDWPLFEAVARGLENSDRAYRCDDASPAPFTSAAQSAIEQWVYRPLEYENRRCQVVSRMEVRFDSQFARSGISQ